MKVRSGFVSNSSSSSFIIAVNENTKVKLEIEVDLNKFSDVKIKTIDDLTNYFLNDLYLEPEDLEEDSEYNKAKEAIQGGKEILIGSFSNDSGDGLENFLCDNGLENNINVKDMIVIRGDGGY